MNTKNLENISANVTLVQLMYLLGNMNHDISVVGNWIFDSIYKKPLVLNRASLDMICAPSVGEEQDAIFETVFTAVRYIYNRAQLKTRYFLSMGLNTVIIVCVAI